MGDQPGTTGPQVEVGLLGPVRAAVHRQSVDLGGARQRALLAALAVEVGRTVSTDALIEAVWDGDPPDAADRTFRTYVARLRRAFDRAGADGAAVVVTGPAGYRLDDDLVGTDVQAFEEEVAIARARLSAGEAAAAADELAAALDRWEGRALGAFADRPWAAPSSTRLEEARRAARELRVRALLDAGRTDRAVALVEQLAAAEPLRESVARLRALALHRTGRDADALQGLREFRERLVDEHGLDPSPRLGELETMVLERDPRLDRTVGGRRLRGYVLHEPVAHSPLGTVHRAEQPSIGREVAVTVLPADVADDADVVRAFEARVQAVAGLDHAHVLPVYDYWREPGGAYVVTRFPSGGTLAQHLRTGSLDATRALAVGEQVAGALAAAHEAGVVHGGIDADAIVIDERGDAFVWAFPVTASAHPRDDVHALATLLVTSLDGEATSARVTTALLPEPAATAVRRVLEPAADTVTTAASLAAAFEAARHGDSRAPSVPVEAGPNPYRGLAAFREVDNHVFFGRDALVEQVRARLARLRAVAVVGPSGAGKSSVVRAGVLPALRGSGAFVTTMLPGTRPLAELETALARVAARTLEGVADEVAAAPTTLRHVVDRVLPSPEGDLVLVVDQFEELFTLTPRAERDLFLDVLVAVVDDPNARVQVVLTLRADFLGRVLSHPVAGELVCDRSVMVGPLTDDELHQAVTRPADVAGVAVEPALATAVVADAARFPGSLPMVQFALTEVFEAAEDGTMTLDAYRRIGGIEGVLGQRAEEVFQRLDERGQQAANALFQRLVVPHDDGPPSRRRAMRTEFSHVPDEVVDAFGKARLLRFDHDQDTREPTVEVTHEALFRAWPRLVAWIEEGEDDLRLLGHLTVSAGEWEDGGRREADLYRGHRLDAALAFAADRRDELSLVERDFLDAARARRARDAEADRRTVRRLRVLTSGLAIGLVVAMVAGTLAFTGQRRETELRRDAEIAQEAAEAAAGREAATAEQAQADALALAASSVRDDDLELAALYAVEAYAIQPDVESQRALLEVLNDSPRLLQVVPAPPSGFCGAMAPGATVAVTGRYDEEDSKYAFVHGFDMSEVASVDVVDGAVCPTTDPLGRWVVTGDETTGILHTYDTATGEVLAELEGWFYPGLSVGDVAVHPLGDEALVTTSDDSILRVGLPGLEVLATIPAPTDSDGLVRARYGESGDLLAAVVADGADSGRVLVTDLDGATVLQTDEIPSLAEAVVSERLGIVVTLSWDGTARVVTFDEPDVAMPLGLRGSTNTSIAVHPDGDRVAVATSEGLEIMDLTSLTLTGDPIGIDTTFGQAAWGPDGELYFQGPAGTATIDLARTTGVGEVIIDETPSQFALWPAPDGSGVIQVAEDGVSWSDASTGDDVRVAPWPTQQAALAILSGGQWLRVDYEGRTFSRWRGDQLLVETSFPASVPDGLVRYWLTVSTDNGVAVHHAIELEDGPTGERPVRTHVLAFDIETGEALAHQVFDDADSSAPRRASALGPDRLFLAFGDGHGEIRSLGGEVLASGPGLTGNGEFVGIAAGGAFIAMSDAASALTVVDDQLRVVARLTGFSSTASHLEFLGRAHLVSRHEDGSTYLWDLRTSQLLGRLFVSPGFQPYGVRAADDGTAVLQSTPGGVVRIPIDPEQWLAAVCGLVDRPLTTAELDAVAQGRTPLDPCGLGDDSV